MAMDETLGVPAHRGGLVVRRPELSVGIVGAFARPDGLEVDLLARRPLDARSAAERQAAIRAGLDAVQPAPRRLLPPYDEGLDLRVGWVDPAGRAHWEFGSRSTSDGDRIHGMTVRTRLHLPPMYDHASLLLAWPEIGFPEAVVDLPLPDRGTVERGTVSVWSAPVTGTPAPDLADHRVDPTPLDEPPVEAGRIVAGPRVVSRGPGAVVALTRVTSVGDLLSLELLSIATGEPARAVTAASFPPPRPSADPARVRADGPGAAVAVVDGASAVWARFGSGGSSGGDTDFRARIELAVPRPAGSVLELLVAWPAAGLSDVLVRVPLEDGSGW